MAVGACRSFGDRLVPDGANFPTQGMPQRARDYQPGERLPGTVYDIVRLIGAGGMGTVYDVEDTTIGKRYVLKTLHPQLGAREDVARRMQKEARTLARLNHSNIVEVITAGVTGDELRLPYYVMERLNGQSLRVVLEKKGQLDLPHAFHIGIDLLDALDHAHDKGVIHRDVKPDNIFLHRTSAGVTVTKLLDFGILSLLDATARETAGRFLGTLRYAAPEQLRGERPTPRVDVYATGLVLYEMIAGRGPFDDQGDPHAIGAAHLDMPPPPLSRFVAVVPELEALIMAALAKAPEARPQDAFSFAASLRKLKRTISGSHRRESTTEDRATAPAVLGQESAGSPYVEVRQSSSDGPYVIAPGRDLGPHAQTSFPKTTLHGISPPTVGRSLADPVTSAPTVTTPDAVDRMAPTRSFVPDTVASPQHGTEPLALAARDAHGPSVGTTPPLPVDLPLRWPEEGASATSEEPQVQTLSVPVQRSWRSAARILTAAATLGVAVVAVAVVVFAWRPLSTSPGSGAALPLAISVTVPSGAPPGVAPKLASALPADEPNARVEAPVAIEAKPPPTTSASPPRKPRTAASATAKAIAPASHLDRPGPGF
jgi:serine/threonine protein kinase